MDISKVIIVVSHIPIVMAAGYALMLYSQMIKPAKIFSYFLFISCVIQLASLALWFDNINNMPLLHIYIPAGFLCLTWFYREVLRNFMDKRILVVTAGAFLVLTIANSLFIQNIYTFNTYALTLESVLIIILSLSTYVFFITEVAQQSGITAIKSLNWINSGLFLYYSSSLLLFYFGEALGRSLPKPLVRFTWVLHSLFSMIMYIFFMIGLRKLPRILKVKKTT